MCTVCVCVFVHVRTFVYDVCVFVCGYYIKLVVVYQSVNVLRNHTHFARV